MIDDPMSNDRLECAPLFRTGLRHAIVGRHSHQAMLLQVFLILLAQPDDSRGVTKSFTMIESSSTSTKTNMVARKMGYLRSEGVKAFNLTN
jgi:hypothetical protein